MRIIGLSFKVHRWLGIGGGLMAFAWFASGFVMHWYSFADPTDVEVLRTAPRQLVAAELPPGLGLAALGQPGVERAGVGAEPSITRARLQYLGDDLTWQVEFADGRTQLMDALDGAVRPPVGSAQAIRLAARVVNADPATARVEWMTEYDELYYSRGFPLPVHRVSFDEPRNVSVYVDPNAGEVAAVIGTAERVSRFFGGIPHFLNVGPMHTQRTLWLVLMSVLVTAVLVSGISGSVYGVWLLNRQLRQRRKERHARRWSMKQGMRTVHHLLGIAAGVLVVTYTLSGYLMLWYPGVEPDPADVARLSRLPDPSTFAITIPEALAAVAANASAPVQALDVHGILERPVYEARHADGTSTLVDGRTGELLTPLPDSLVRAVVGAYVPDAARIENIAYLERHDPYYYYSLHGRARPLPVFRIDLSGPDVPSPVYIDADGGQLTGRVDGNYRLFRWIGSGLHTFDFPALFTRPRLWDIAVVIAAFAGVVITATGLWLGSLHLVRLARRAKPLAQ